jgi:hypothetical protein
MGIIQVGSFVSKEFSKLILIGPALAHTKMLEEYRLNSPDIYIYNGTVPFDLVYKLQTLILLGKHALLLVFAS